ncbi:MAG: alkaline phosphatase family protein [Chloroflexi bacterium]|nr:alkaline phosphatase family protein [Chloroflexota bacterium]
MTTAKATESTLAPPERLVGQGLDSNQEESGNRAIHLLLTHPVVGEQVDFVATYRDSAYEVWSARGMIRFQRSYADGGGFEYNIIETAGENPIQDQDTHAVSSLDEELKAAAESGHPTDDANTAFIEPAQLTYPFAYERITQLFDSPNAPDIVVNPKCFAFGQKPGQHGALDIVQSRAPLVFCGPGVRAGVVEDAARHVDIAPTIAHAMGFPKIEGRDSTGRPSSDLYLKRQDGRVLEEVFDGGDAKPERAYIFHLDGQSNSELRHRLEDPDALPNLRRLIERGCMFRYGSITNFPSITWPSHNTIGTGAWGGHHDIVNPTFYMRETREVVTPQGQQFDTAKFLSSDVETLYDAFHRVYGPWEGQKGAFTASIHEPCGRGADHSVLERRIIGDRDRLRSITHDLQDEISPRWLADEQEGNHREAILDCRGIAQVLVLFTEDSHPPPAFTYHNFALTDGAGHDYGPHHAGQREALDRTDRRIGHVLDMLEENGLFESTLFIFTADHGMAPTKTELAANPVQLLPDEGLKAVVPSPLVYLIDMDIDIEHARDGRTATMTVLANDVDEKGERPCVAGAEITVTSQGKTLSHATTDDYGVAGVPLLVDQASEEVIITITHEDYNPRHLRLDGTNIALNLRELLYGQS